MNRPLVFASVMFLLCLKGANGQMSTEVPRTQKIPGGFKTYSLFLVCNPEWLTAEKSKDLYALYSQFKNFGRTIGPDNDAVWFWLRDAHADSDLAKNVDVERSVRFCQAWKLKPSAGPHLVVTCTYPDESSLSSGTPKDTGVYELGNMKSNEIGHLLASLTDALLEMRGRSYSLSTPNYFWEGLLESTQRLINSFGCAWSFKVDAGPVNASLQACQTK